MSRITKLISSKSVIGELYSDFNITQSDFVSKSQRWVQRAMEMMQLVGYFKLRVTANMVKEGRCPLPCDIKYLGAVLGQSYDQSTIVQSSSYGDFPYDLDANNININQYSRIPIRESFIYGTKFTNAFQEGVGVKGYINNNWLNLNIDEGKVYFIYFAPPCDDEGYPMIVQDAWVEEALPFYVIYRMCLSGWKHPVISMEYAENKWNTLYPRASNSVNFPDVEEMQQITEMNNNPMLGDLGNQLFMY